MSLAEFLLARIAEDEVGPRKWLERQRERTNALMAAGEPVPLNYRPADDIAVDTWVLVPRRVLAECAAKRRIVEHITNVERYADGSPGIGGIDPDSLPAVTHILRVLALPYADRVDYQPEWRV
jgi:hypothetical protein